MPNEELKQLRKEVAALAEELASLRKYAPPIAAKRARQIRLGFEAVGLAFVAVGVWWIYPQAAFVVVGAWMLGDVLAMRHVKKKRND